MLSRWWLSWEAYHRQRQTWFGFVGEPFSIFRKAGVTSRAEQEEILFDIIHHGFALRLNNRVQWTLKDMEP